MLKDAIENIIPFNRFLGIKVVKLERGKAVLWLPFKPEFIGDPSRPAMHGGVISSLMDAAGGAAAFTELNHEDRLSTVDLLVDYLLPGGSKPLEAEASVIRIGNRVAVVQIHVRQEGHNEVIAQGRAVYNVVRSAKKTK
jgi:uncharacterized protein (TIGR00369 family)